MSTMNLPVPQKLSEHINRQLGYLRRSCELYDQGASDEAIRIALTIRVLLHDSSRSVSLLSLADQKGIKLLSSIPWHPPEIARLLLETMCSPPYRARAFSGLAIPKRRSDGKFELRPSLGKKEHCVLISTEDWWNHLVCYLPHATGILSRRDIVLAAANKDGGAHVDLDVPQEYTALRVTRLVGFRPAAVDESLSPDNPTMQDYEIAPLTVQDAHFACLRQMGYELLLSEDLLILGGQSLVLSERPIIWPF